MNRARIGELVEDQRIRFLSRETGTPRLVNIKRHFEHQRVVVISGIRRCGKSTLMRQIASSLGDEFHYLNLDDERLLDFQVQDFDTVLLGFHGRSPCRTILLDEVQNVPGWERFVRRIHDDGYKVFITGSNARLLSRELGTHLTGRTTRIELHPFSFQEALTFQGIDPASRTSEARARIQLAFQTYLEEGGFPEFLRHRDPELLQRTYEDILFRDIVARHGIRDVHMFQRLSHYLMSNWTGEINYSRLGKALAIPSATSIRNHMAHLQESCLIHEIPKYDASLRQQHLHARKTYVTDNGMRNAVAFSTSDDRGKALENAVFMELIRRNRSVYFFKGRRECDFVAMGGETPPLLIQVSWELAAHNQLREQAGMEEAMKALPDARPLVLTLAQSESWDVAGRTVPVQEAWRWFLGEE